MAYNVLIPLSGTKSLKAGGGVMRRTRKQGGAKVSRALSAELGAWIRSEVPRLIWLGTLGGFSGHAYGVSADGSVVVGSAIDASGRWRAFRWKNGTVQDLGTLGGDQSGAYGVSADGKVVVGGVENASYQPRARSVG